MTWSVKMPPSLNPCPWVPPPLHRALSSTSVWIWSPFPLSSPYLDLLPFLNKLLDTPKHQFPWKIHPIWESHVLLPQSLKPGPSRTKSCCPRFPQNLPKTDTTLLKNSESPRTYNSDSPNLCQVIHILTRESKLKCQWKSWIGWSRVRLKGSRYAC